MEESKSVHIEEIMNLKEKLLFFDSITRKYEVILFRIKFYN